MRFEVGRYAVEWYRGPGGGFWYEVYDGSDFVSRGWSIFPPQELDTEATVETLLEGIRRRQAEGGTERTA